MEELLRAAMPPDEEMGDRIEWAFLEGQIDGLKADLAYWWLWTAERTYRARSPAH
jgi:hypothetical protein